MISPTTAAFTIWVAWLAVWLITARLTAATVEEQSGPSRLLHLAFIWVGAILLFFHPRSAGALLQPLFTASATLSWLGVALVAAGLGFASWARFHLGQMWSGTVTLKQDHRIIRTGPYRLVRHPIYTGLVLALAGTALTDLTSAAMIGLVLISGGLIIKFRQEENLLARHFGAAYDNYRRAVKALVPYIW